MQQATFPFFTLWVGVSIAYTNSYHNILYPVSFSRSFYLGEEKRSYIVLYM